ncbi:helix-turn-helix transcriptional regulator [Acidaminobacter sp. JC074]|uniref:helix-turn-helix domain-containing protein n=1 Tax=Acidaminobacter sp. JC074 TaxID=2530199 RepID=UPI001F0F536C|nr:AraC family transcriptional regulator [Acidaminobacter sp. JC074]MCH4890129.1 helix-turn-helix transcriptional regulator [Acidaminobacter sp. JC074]
MVNNHIFYKWMCDIDLFDLERTNDFYHSLFRCENDIEFQSVLNDYKYLFEVYETLYDDRKKDLSNFKWVLTTWVAFTYREVQVHNVDARKALNTLIEYNVKVKEASTTSELHALIKSMLKAFLKLVQLERLRASDPITIHVKKYVRRNISKKINLTDISDSLGYNKEYLSHHFKRVEGISIVDYIHYKRVELAKEILINSTAKMDDITIYAGFSSNSNFFRTFKKLTGMTPKAYRKSYAS